MAATCATAGADVPAVVTPRVAGAPLIPGTLAYDLDRFMNSKDGLPRTFTFDAVNFDSGTANLRGADDRDLNDIARVLAAYPNSRAAVVGYADARGRQQFQPRPWRQPCARRGDARWPRAACLPSGSRRAAAARPIPRRPTPRRADGSRIAVPNW